MFTLAVFLFSPAARVVAGRQGDIEVDTIHAIVLGVIQGLTEFLPVSSSGHLAVTQILMDFGDSGIVMDVCLHMGTLLAILIVFRNDIFDFFRIVPMLPRLVSNFNESRRRDESFWLIILILCGTFVTAFVGLLGEKLFLGFFKSLKAVGICFLITGTILWFTRFTGKRRTRRLAEMNVVDALTIGLAQGVAIAPGISRSGTTISSALFLGLDRELAARYSFLLFIPAVVGANILELRHWENVPYSLTAIAAGSISAFIVGYLALKLLLNVVKRGAFHYFSFYCWFLGTTVLIYSFMR